MNKLKKRIYVLPLILTILTFVGVGVVLAYLTKSEQMTNRFTIGEVETTIVETFNPPPTLTPGNNDYVKEVAVKNTGTSESYVRVAIEFSDKTIRDTSYFFSTNGNAYYTIDDFKNHLPSDWVYISNPALGGDYYYYTKKVKAGETTPKLFTKVRTAFADEASIVPYDIFVYAEGIQAIDAKGDPKTTSAQPYLEVWKSFLKAS